MSQPREDVFARSARPVAPGKVRVCQAYGIDGVMAPRDGACFGDAWTDRRSSWPAA